jgi:hypothetical protein
MLVIDDELRAFVEADLSVHVGTRNANMVPDSVRGWAPKVSPDGRALELFVDRPASTVSVTNLRDNGRIAVCLSNIVTNRSVQLKGRCVELGDPLPGDWQWLDRHRQAFMDTCSMIGFPPPVIRNMWSTQVVKIRFVPEDIYNQTPGPGAGKAL